MGVKGFQVTLIVLHIKAEKHEIDDLQKEIASDSVFTFHFKVKLFSS